MFTAKQYRAKAAEYTELRKATTLPAETREFRKLEQSYLTLAENEEWMAGNLEKINCQGAAENWYGDAIAYARMPWGRHRNAVDCDPNKIQLVFNDAGSMAGLVPTATLRDRSSASYTSIKVDAADSLPARDFNPHETRSGGSSLAFQNAAYFPTANTSSSARTISCDQRGSPAHLAVRRGGLVTSIFPGTAGN
jgi:hypothetical protein